MMHALGQRIVDPGFIMDGYREYSIHTSDLARPAVQLLGWHLRPLHIRSPAQDIPGCAEVALDTSCGQGEECVAPHDLHHQLIISSRAHGLCTSRLPRAVPLYTKDGPLIRVALDLLTA